MSAPAPARARIVRRDDVRPVLATDHRVRKIDRHLEPQRGCGVRLVHRLAIDHANGLGQLQILCRLLPERHPSLGQGVHRRGRAAVQDRRLRAFDIDQQIVDIGAPATAASTCSTVCSSAPSRAPATGPALGETACSTRAGIAGHPGDRCGERRLPSPPAQGGTSIRYGSPEVQPASLERNRPRDRPPTALSPVRRVTRRPR